MHMATVGEQQTLSEEYSDVNCTICTIRGRKKQAQTYCKDCRKNLCCECLEYHNVFNEGHTLFDGHGENAEVNLLTEKCEKHTDKVIKFFCVDHDELVCGTCALLEHRKCDELKHIVDSIEDLNKDQQVYKVPEQIKTALQNVDQVLTGLEEHIEELSQCEHKFLEEIEEYTKRLLSKIETLKQNARKEISSTYEQAASESKAKRTVCATAKTDIMKCMDDMTSAGNRKAHLFILKKKGQSMTKNVETLCKGSERMMKCTRFLFVPDGRIEDTLDKFTSLVTEEGKCFLIADINASVKDDSRSCDIKGCCILPDGTVLLTDNNNKRVIHMDPSDTSIKHHCDMTTTPWGITCIRPRELAVSTNSTSVSVISLGNTLSCTSTIQLQHHCISVTQSNGELFTADDKCVYVHDLTGTLLRTIRKNASGEDMFSTIRGIVLNQTGDRVYVADNGKGLICTDRAGQEVFRLSGDQLGLSGVWGVCTDQRGNVLVCGFWSNNVVKVTHDGRVVGEILSKADGIENPRCLCYDADRRRLYVGGSTSKLLMYRMM